MIQFFFEEVHPINFSDATTKWLESIIEKENKKKGKITYIFCTDDALLEVNRKYLKHDYLTDIITFDYVKGSTISADIFVSLPRVQENAQIHEKTVDSELHRVLAHGILHLCGYRDKTTEEAAMMRKKEELYLSIR